MQDAFLEIGVLSTAEFNYDEQFKSLDCRRKLHHRYFQPTY